MLPSLPITRPEGWEGGYFIQALLARRDSCPNRRRDEATAALVPPAVTATVVTASLREASQSRRDWHGSSQDATRKAPARPAAASAGAGIARARDSAPFCCVVTTATRAHAHTCPQGWEGSSPYPALGSQLVLQKWVRKPPGLPPRRGPSRRLLGSRVVCIAPPFLHQPLRPPWS